MIWYGDSGADQADHVYTQQSMNVSGAYRPVAGDFDGDGKDEVFWYGPGSQADSLWDFTSRSTYTGTSKSVSGANYLPVAGDFDGDGDDDVVFNDWTVDGGDTLWWGPGLSSASHLTVSLATGQLPFAGDFDGDGRDDVFVNQYGAGGDTVWWGSDRGGFSTADTGFAASAVTMAAAYSYGADGTRTAKTVDGTTTEFTYSDNGGLPLLLEQTTGTDTTYVIYGPGDQPIEQINPDGTALWLHHDQLGSVRMATKASDSTEHSRRTYNAYGTVASESVVTAGTKQPLLSYAGQYTDRETGYQYLRARYYDPTGGQFLTRDPVAVLTGQPYSYGGSSPANETDPTGLCTANGGAGDCEGWIAKLDTAVNRNARGQGTKKGTHGIKERYSDFFRWGMDWVEPTMRGFVEGAKWDTHEDQFTNLQEHIKDLLDKIERFGCSLSESEQALVDEARKWADAATPSVADVVAQNNGNRPLGGHDMPWGSIAKGGLVVLGAVGLSIADLPRQALGGA